jgi:hypothetical protein
MTKVVVELAVWHTQETDIEMNQNTRLIKTV